ncbi:MAG: shikimate kinase, partial [Dehalococcoidia bacterium]|nr:shikimate kinase [Dehalococcoidia bacterium]
MSRSESGHNIFIVGFPTTGKSQTARKVAVLLGWDWLDTDAEIVRLTGKSIEMIFAEDGEEQFRKLERWVLKTASSKNGTVIAAGG